MPNWCENKLVVRGEEIDMAKFKKTMDIANLLHSFVPVPKDQEDNWYQWCIDNWGTKWDVVDCIMKLGSKTCPTSDTMRFGFLTAWAPPIPWLEKVGAIFPNLWLKLDYDAPGMMFRGTACGRGEIIDEYEEYE